MGGPHGQFPSTQLSLLEAATSGASLPNEALERVSALYWKPVYRFIRVRFRKDNEDAKDLTQSFFATALQRDFFTRFDPAKASFRTYLRVAVERFAASQHAAAKRQKRGGGVEFEPVDDQAVTAESPEQAFEREWQRQLFALALDDLRDHCEACGKQLQFEIFEAYDLAAGDRPSYADLAARQGIGRDPHVWAVALFAAMQATLPRGIRFERGGVANRWPMYLPSARMSSRNPSTLRACGADDGTANRTPSAWMISLARFSPKGKSCFSCGSLFVSGNGLFLPSPGTGGVFSTSAPVD